MPSLPNHGPPVHLVDLREKAWREHPLFADIKAERRTGRCRGRTRLKVAARCCEGLQVDPVGGWGVGPGKDRSFYS